MKKDLLKPIIFIGVIGIVWWIIIPIDWEILRYAPYVVLGAFVIWYILRNKTGIDKNGQFQNKMNELGYTKRKVVYDFLSPNVQADVNKYGLQYQWTVGIWLNYNEKKMILRTERDNWTAKVIPFSKIQHVEMIEDGYTVTSGAAIGFGAIAVGSATSTAYVKGLKVRIVKGDINTGTEAFFLNLYDPEWGAKFNKSDARYKSIQECARSIADEIINIINHQW
jgi:hypothetical protein